MSPSTRVRSAVNRQLFLREVNNKLLDMYSILEILQGESTEFICECAAPECLERIVVPLPDYRRVRRDPMRFIVDVRHRPRALGREMERHAGWCEVETTHPDLVP